MKINNEDGYVLVLGIIILGALIILVFVMTNIIGMDLSFYRNNRDSDRAFYAAESGIAYGTEVFWKDGYYTTPSPFTLKDDKKIDLYESEIDNLSWIYLDDNIVKFNSIGISNGKLKEIVAEYDFTLSGFTNAITAKNMQFGNNINVKGDLAIPTSSAISYPEKNFIHDGNEKYEEYDLGDIFNSEFQIAKENYDDPSNPNDNTDNDTGHHENAYNQKEENTKLFVPEEDEDTDYPDITELTNISSYSDLTDSTNSTTYIYGNTKLNGDISGEGILVVYGNLELGNNLSINSGNEDEYFGILVKGNITPDQANKNEMNAFIYAGGDVVINNSGLFRGIIYSEGSFEAKNTSYDENEFDFEYRPESEEIVGKILSKKWNEVAGVDKTVQDIISWSEQ